MTENDQSQAQTQATQGKRTISTADIFKNVDLEGKLSQRQGSNAREELKKDMAELDKYTDVLRQLERNTKVFATELQTGYNPDKASFTQKAIALVPIVGKKWAASFQEKGYIARIQGIMKEIGTINIEVDNLGAKIADSHDELYHHATQTLIDEQQKAVKSMEKHIEAIDRWNTKIAEQTTLVDTLRKDASKRDEYLEQDQQLNDMKNALFMEKQELIKSTVDYDVAEDVRFESLQVVEQYKRAIESISVFNHKVKKKMEYNEELINKKQLLNKYVDAGLSTLDIDTALDDALRVDAVATSKKIRYISEIVLTELPTRTYESVIPLQVQLNQETKAIIDATQAAYVERARSGQNIQTYEALQQAKTDAAQDKNKR